MISKRDDSHKLIEIHVHYLQSGRQGRYSIYTSLATKNTSVLRTRNVSKSDRLKLGMEHS